MRTQLRVRSAMMRYAGKALLVVLSIYLLAYASNSWTGGYYLEGDRDGKVRYAPEFGGLSLPVAIMWQPRYGHKCSGQMDALGIAFAWLIDADRAWIHPTHYLTNSNYDSWLGSLPVSQVHPKFREEFVKHKQSELSVSR